MSNEQNDNEQNTDTRTGTGLDSSDPVERFNAAATTSRVTVELPDGRRRVTVKNHETGEVTERVLPALDRPFP